MPLNPMATENCNVRRAASRGEGFTLIEVLVSLVVLSIGLLGTAKLMIFSARSNDSAYLRTQATALAYGMLDNMRANQQQAIAGSYATALNAAATNPGFTWRDRVHACQSRLVRHLPMEAAFERDQRNCAAGSIARRPGIGCHHVDRNANHGRNHG
jgi:type IV pilus modification protein PilV